MSERKPTVNSVKKDIDRANKALEIRVKKQTVLKNEIADLTKRIRELEKLYETLCQEDLKNKIATSWITDNKMTDKQILELLEVGNQIHDKIDVLGADAVVKAVNDVYEKAGSDSRLPTAKENAGGSSD